jgi:hypothetical protein
MSRRVSLALTVSAAAVLLVAGGCQSSKARDIRMNPSPEVDTLYQRDADIDNALTVTFDENLRMLKQDLGRAFYTDRPSRLTRETIPMP